jgi:hypothetical protein
MLDSIENEYTAIPSGDWPSLNFGQRIDGSKFNTDSTEKAGGEVGEIVARMPHA